MAISPSLSAPSAYPTSSLAVSNTASTAKSVAKLHVFSANATDTHASAAIGDVGQTALAIGMLLAGIVLLATFFHMMFIAKPHEPKTYVQWWIAYNKEMLNLPSATVGGAHISSQAQAQAVHPATTLAPAPPPPDPVLTYTAAGYDAPAIPMNTLANPQPPAHRQDFASTTPLSQSASLP